MAVEPGGMAIEPGGMAAGGPEAVTAGRTDPRAAGETVLHGGNTSVVVRVGDTVCRTPGPWNPAVHALLAHLARVGFHGAPEVRGFDERGREVLAYVPGEVGVLGPGQPLPQWFRTDDACMAVGDWLRRFHEAQRGFAPDPALPWRMQAGRELLAGEVVVHHDVAPYNTIRGPGGALTVIDWDFCRPGDPLEDLAFSAWQWAPLWADERARREDHAAAPELADVARRLCVLAQGYRATPAQRGGLLDAAIAQMLQHADDVEGLAEADLAFRRLVEAGVARNARLDARWVERHRARLQAALDDPSPH